VPDQHISTNPHLWSICPFTISPYSFRTDLPDCADWFRPSRVQTPGTPKPNSGSCTYFKIQIINFCLKMNYIRFIHPKKGSADLDVVPFVLDYPHPLFSHYTFNRLAFIFRILVSSKNDKTKMSDGNWSEKCSFS